MQEKDDKEIFKGGCKWGCEMLAAVIESECRTGRPKEECMELAMDVLTEKLNEYEQMSTDELAFRLFKFEMQALKCMTPADLAKAGVTDEM